MEEAAKKINHYLVPQHTKLTEESKQELLNALNLNQKQLPQILASDPAIKDLNANIGDIIKIVRNSPTAKETIFYRVVVNG